MSDVDTVKRGQRVLRRSLTKLKSDISGELAKVEPDKNVLKIKSSVIIREYNELEVYNTRMRECIAKGEFASEEEEDQEMSAIIADANSFEELKARVDLV